MTNSLLTALVEEKLLMRYLSTINQNEYTQAQVLLVECLSYAILTSILPFYEPSEHSSIVDLLTNSDAASQKKWLLKQPTEVKISIRETVERIFLSLQ